MPDDDYTALRPRITSEGEDPSLYDEPTALDRIREQLGLGSGVELKEINGRWYAKESAFNELAQYRGGRFNAQAVDQLRPGIEQSRIQDGGEAWIPAEAVAQANAVIRREDPPSGHGFLSRLAGYGPQIASAAFLGGALSGGFTGATEGATAGAGTGVGTVAGGSAPFIAPEALGAGTALTAPVAGSAPLTLSQIATGVGAAGTASQVLSGGDSPYDPATGGGSGGYDAPTGTGFEPPVTAQPWTPGQVGQTGSALSRIIDGTAQTADWVQVLGTGGATALGLIAGNQQAGALERLAGQSRQDRAPYLQASQGWLANPQSYIEGPGQAALQGTLASLSSKFGNPLGSGTALQLASGAALNDWRDAVTGFGNLGLQGEDVRANLGIGAAGADANRYTTLAGGLSDIISPRRSLSDLLREYRGLGLA